MTGNEWMRFCIEKRTSQKQKDIMLVKRVNQRHEKRLVDLFKEKEAEWFVIVALDTTRRRTLTFATFYDEEKLKCIWVDYSKKEKRFTNITYVEDGCWHHIFLKHSIYLK